MNEQLIEKVDPFWTDLAKVKGKDLRLCFLKLLSKFCRPPQTAVINKIWTATYEIITSYAFS